METELNIRSAVPEDAKALLEIYAPYVKRTAITFEYDVPSEEEFSGRIRHTLQEYPYLVAELDGKPVGYAYAGHLNPRAAYDWSVEMSVYVRRDCHGAGIGKTLYQELERRLKEMHITNVYACIAWTEHEDEYLTNASARFHEHLGYRLIGTFHQCGYKFGRWYDMIWMEKIIGEHKAQQPPVWKR